VSIVPRRRPASPLVVGVLVTLLVSSCGWSDEGSDADGSGAPLTVAQPDHGGAPGELIDATPRPDAPAGTRAWDMTYFSRTAADDPVAVTGQLITPDGSPPPGGWPVVAWAHPTTGTADECAPSLQGPAAIHLVAELTAAGVAIAATDYEGLGTEGGHPYLVGPSEGHTVLDAVRAGRTVDAAGIAEASPVVIAGFSQGGHAALWAAQLAPAYAPDLEVLGVQAVAPVTDVTRFAERAEGYDEQFGVLVAIAYGFAQAYPELDLDDILTPEAVELLDATEEQCIGDLVMTYTRPVAEMMRASPRVVPGWSDRLAENTAGLEPLGLPVHVLQGADDPIVFELVTTDLVDRLCAAGDVVQYDVVEGADHAVLTPERTVGWILARFAGDPPPSNCA
jgi:acetyl esterase/lipase